MVAHRSSHENTSNEYSSSDPDIDRLHADLDDAERRIAEAMTPEPESIEDWEQFWIDLLRSYQDIHDNLAATAARFETGGGA